MDTDAEAIMQAPNLRLVQRASAIFLLTAAVIGLCLSLAALWFAPGLPGFAVVSGLAAVFGMRLRCAEPSRGWHWAALAVHVSLALATLLSWPGVLAKMIWIGYALTVLHLAFAELQLFAVTAAGFVRPPSTYRLIAARDRLDAGAARLERSKAA